jgi:hypothetical protein
MLRTSSLAYFTREQSFSPLPNFYIIAVQVEVIPNMKFHFGILLLAAMATAMPDPSLCVEKVPEGADPTEVGLSQISSLPKTLG